MSVPTAPAAPTRGYALAIVLLVAVVLSGAVTAMFFKVGAAQRLGAAARGERRGFHLCNGVVSVASKMLADAAVRGTSLSDLNASLAPLRDGVAADGIELEELSAAPSETSRISVVPSGPLVGMEVSIVDLDLAIALKAPHSPPCRARHTQPLASVSVFQFPAFSSFHLSVPRNADYDVPRDNSYAWGQFSARVEDPKELKGVTDEQASLSLPTAGTNVANLAFLLRSPSSKLREDPERPPMRAPTSSSSTRFGNDTSSAPPPPPSAEDVGVVEAGEESSIAFDADIRIVDGKWFIRDPNDSRRWPGIPIWSDHPCEDRREGNCSTVGGAGRRRHYSIYERNAAGFIDAASGPSGVVSYGGLLRGGVVGANLSGETCKFPRDPATNAPPPEKVGQYRECGRFESSDGPEKAGKGGNAAGIVEAARAGFTDPGVGPILPINIHAGLLGFALDTKGRGELGEHLCLPPLPGDPVPCRRVFNGIIYVTTTHGHAPSASAGPGPAAASGAATHLPWPLCGTLTSAEASLENGESPGFFDGDVMRGCEDSDWVRPNAVRVHGGQDLRRFAETGLTIVTDLPLYVMGDWNVTGGYLPTTALLGERVTLMSNDWTDRFHPMFGGRNFPSSTPPAPPPRSPSVQLRGSVFSGSAAANDVGQLLRGLEPSLDVNVTGALAIGFRSYIPDQPVGLRVRFPQALQGASVRSQPPGAPRAAFVLPGSRRAER